MRRLNNEGVWLMNGVVNEEVWLMRGVVNMGCG